MNSPQYPIDKYIKIISFEVDGFSIASIDVIPYQSATIICILYHGETQVANQKLVMQGEAYNNWSNNDSYLIDWIKLQLPLNSK